MSIRDLRTFLKDYEKEYPNDVIHVEKPIRCRYEISAVVIAFEKKGKFPLLIFHKPITAKDETSKFPVIINLLASRSKLAYAIGSTFDDLSLDWIQKAENEGKTPVTVQQSESPCKEVIYNGDEIDLLDIPLLVHHELDAGPYISAGHFVSYDPDSMVDNVGVYRGFVSDKREIRVWFEPRAHAKINMAKNEALGKDTPCAFWIGHHPAVPMGCYVRPPYPKSHYFPAGGTLGSPLRLVSSETLGDDFLVPADAEFVIEGFLKAGVRKSEAPFGEYTGYYGPERENPVMEVTCVTHRKDAYWHSHMVGHNTVFSATAQEAALYSSVRRVVPNVTKILIPPAAKQFMVYIQLKKTMEGQAKSAIMAALTSALWVKYAIVVDEDIDVRDDTEVLWAIASRTRAERDIYIIPDMAIAGLDPSGYDLGQARLGTKVGIDATKPIDIDFPEKIDIPAEVKKSIRLEDYLTKDKIEKVPNFLTGQ